MYLMIWYLGEMEKLNMFQSITSALDLALAKDPTAGMRHLNVSCNKHELSNQL